MKQDNRGARMEQMRAENPFLSNTEVVYRLIREDIVEHRMKPGQKINKEQLADELNISRTPVRDALAILENDGYLIKGAQGYVVYEMKIGDYMMLLDLRIAIERLAVRLACSRIRNSEAEKIKKNLDETRALLEKCYNTAWDKDFAIIDEQKAKKLFFEFGKKDQEFHRLVVAASHNKYVIQAYDDLLPKIHFFRFFALDVNAILNMVERHQMIYKAIISRDEELAEHKMQTHLALTVSRAMRY